MIFAPEIKIHGYRNTMLLTVTEDLRVRTAWVIPQLINLIVSHKVIQKHLLHCSTVYLGIVDDGGAPVV